MMQQGIRDRNLLHGIVSTAEDASSIRLSSRKFLLVIPSSPSQLQGVIQFCVLQSSQHRSVSAYALTWVNVNRNSPNAVHHETVLYRKPLHTSPWHDVAELHMPYVLFSCAVIRHKHSTDAQSQWPTSPGLWQ